MWMHILTNRCVCHAQPHQKTSNPSLPSPGEVNRRKISRGAGGECTLKLPFFLIYVMSVLTNIHMPQPMCGSQDNVQVSVFHRVGSEGSKTFNSLSQFIFSVSYAVLRTGLGAVPMLGKCSAADPCYESNIFLCCPDWSWAQVTYRS